MDTFASKKHFGERKRVYRKRRKKEENSKNDKVDKSELSKSYEKSRNSNLMKSLNKPSWVPENVNKTRRLTTNGGIFNHGKMCNTVLRNTGLISKEIRARTDADLKRILNLAKNREKKIGYRQSPSQCQADRDSQDINTDEPVESTSKEKSDFSFSPNDDKEDAGMDRISPRLSKVSVQEGQRCETSPKDQLLEESYHSERDSDDTPSVYCDIPPNNLDTVEKRNCREITDKFLSIIDEKATGMFEDLDYFEDSILTELNRKLYKGATFLPDETEAKRNAVIPGDLLEKFLLKRSDPVELANEILNISSSGSTTTHASRHSQNSIYNVCFHQDAEPQFPAEPCCDSSAFNFEPIFPSEPASRPTYASLECMETVNNSDESFNDALEMVLPLPEAPANNEFKSELKSLSPHDEDQSNRKLFLESSSGSEDASSQRLKGYLSTESLACSQDPDFPSPKYKFTRRRMF